MHEILPIASGLLLGGLLAFRRFPVYVRLLLVLILAVCATTASGEFRLSWGFLFPDIVEVTVSCAAAFFAAKAWERFSLRRP
jgi:anaerobic C4-dicarboxylate transporter